MKSVAYFTASLAFALALCTSPDETLDRFGGTTAVKGDSTGFFHVEKQGDRWELIDPDGNAFFCVGMSIGRGRGDTMVAHDRLLLKNAGFNTFTGSDTTKTGHTPYVRIVGCSGGRRTNTFKDVFAKSFEENAMQRITRRCSTMRDDPWLIGYFTDNELPWNMVWGGGFFDDYLNLPFDSAGHGEAIRFAQECFGDLEQFNKVWGTEYQSWDSVGGGNFEPGHGFDKLTAGKCRDEFLYLVSKRYHGFLYKAFKSVDPNHMVMGNRFLTGDIPMPVIKGMKGNVDVISTNCYALRTWPSQTFERFCETVGAPIMITEYGFAANDAGVEQDLPGAIPRLIETQEQRADRYEWYNAHAAGSPYCIGTVWWHFMDGFWSHDRGNFGFLSKTHKLYQTIYDRAAEVNSRVYRLRAKRKAPANPVPPEYAIATVENVELDGAVDTSSLDIVLDNSCRYEGFGFDTAGFYGLASLRQSGDNLIVFLRVYDRRVDIYDSAWMADSMRNIWEIDGMELRLGRYESLFRFTDSVLTCSWVSADPFPGIVCKGTLLDDGYSMEISLPLAELVDVVNGGMVLFAVGINDGEANKGRYRQLQWPPSFEWIYHESYARGRLNTRS